MIGEKFDDRYEILEELGATPFCLSYKARDLAEDRLVAVKVLREEYSFDQDLVQKFLARAAVVPEVSNLKNIAEVYASGQQGGKVFMVRQYVEGSSLRHRLEQVGGRLPLEAVKYLGAQICEALFAAHQKNLIHAGLNPNDILITPDDEVKITDFGLSHLALLRSLSAEEFTVASLDSLRYAAPEQFQTEKVEDPRTDLYQAGIIFHEMLLGRAPVGGESFQEYREGHLHGPAPVQPEVLHQALQRDPAARFQGGRDLEDALGQLTDLPPILAVSPMKLDLADITKGQKKAAVLVVSNGGGGELSGKVEIDPRYAPHVSVENREFVLTPAPSGEGRGLFLKKVEVRLEVDTFHLEGGPHEARLRIVANAGELDMPVVWRVRLEGGAAETEEFTMIPAVLNFGRLRWRQQKEMHLELRNTFDHPLAGKIRVSPAENLTLTGWPPEADGSYRLAMAPKSRIKVGVVFSRQNLPPGEFRGSLELQVPGEVKTIPVTARLLEPPRLKLAAIPGVGKKSGALAALALILLLGGYYWGVPAFQARQLSGEVEAKLQMGAYQDALERMRQGAGNEARFQEIRGKLNRPLTLRMQAWFIDPQGQKREWNLETVPRIPSGGQYRFLQTVDASSYLYLIQVDSHRNVSLLFPNQQFSSGSNPLLPGKTMALPDKKPAPGAAAATGKTLWFYLDDKAGREIFYMVAAPWPSLDLEQIIQQINASSSPAEKQKLTAQLINRLKTRQQALDAGLRGVFYREFHISHEP